MIRTATLEDTPFLIELARQTRVFKPHELVALEEVLNDYHEINREENHQAFVLEGEKPLGFVYFAPTAMTDQTWELWWIVVDPNRHGQGWGRKLLAFVEEQVRMQRGRLLLIDTSSTPLYQPTRAFYEKVGYRIAAQIPDFYCDGDDKVIFWKRMREGSSGP